VYGTEGRRGRNPPCTPSEIKSEWAENHFRFAGDIIPESACWPLHRRLSPPYSPRRLRPRRNSFLQDYIGQSRVEKDPVALGYVAERCSALYSVFGKNLEGETDPERQRVMAEAFNAGERFMGLAVKLMISGTTIGVEVVLRRTQKTWRTWATSTLTALRQPGFAPATCSGTT